MKRDAFDLPPQAQIDAVVDAMLATECDVVLWHREPLEEIAGAAIDAIEGRSIGTFGGGVAAGLLLAVAAFVVFKVFM